MCQVIFIIIDISSVMVRLYKCIFFVSDVFGFGVLGISYIFAVSGLINIILYLQLIRFISYIFSVSGSICTIPSLGGEGDSHPEADRTSSCAEAA